MINLNIHGLELETILGFWPEERVKKQRVIIHLTLGLNEEGIVDSDDVDRSVDYAKLCDELKEKVPTTSFNLVEALTHFVMEIVWKNERLQYAHVTVEKPDAPLEGIEGISCELERNR